ncbi:MAG: RidA family protein [Alphaproteobacteria bacterium]|nr:RidA family protein [Alphaproteobacteria bacterium]
MPHARLRKFNTRDAYPEQKLDNDLSMVVRAGNHLFLRGQTAMDLDGRIVGVGDPAAQAENAMKCAKILLEEAGASLADVCKITIYITEREYREPVYGVVGRWLKGVYPVSTGLIVKGLAKPEYLMEIDIDAVIADKPARPRRAAARRPVTKTKRKVKAKRKVKVKRKARAKSARGRR